MQLRSRGAIRAGEPAATPNTKPPPKRNGKALLRLEGGGTKLKTVKEVNTQQKKSTKRKIQQHALGEGANPGYGAK